MFIIEGILYMSIWCANKLSIIRIALTYPLRFKCDDQRKLSIRQIIMSLSNHAFFSMGKAMDWNPGAI